MDTIVQPPTATMMQAIPQQTMIHPGMQQISIQQPDGMLVIQQRGMQQAQIQLIPETNPKLQQPSNQLVEQTDGVHDVDILIHPGENSKPNTATKHGIS